MLRYSYRYIGSDNLGRGCHRWRVLVRVQPEGYAKNMGSPRYPKLVCGPCRACGRAMQNQIKAAGNAEVKKNYHTMVRTNPGEYKSMIRSARIATTADMPGVSTIAQRDAQLSCYTQRIVSEVPRYRALQHQEHSVKHNYSWLDCSHINPMFCMC